MQKLKNIKYDISHAYLLKYVRLAILYFYMRRKQIFHFLSLGASFVEDFSIQGDFFSSRYWVENNTR
jgi:hypothetical protein